MGVTGVPRGEGGRAIVLMAPKTVATSPEDGQSRLKQRARARFFVGGGNAANQPSPWPSRLPGGMRCAAADARGW